MSFKVSRAAEADLANIYADSVELFGYRQADRYLNELWDRFGTIAADPLMAPERKELGRNMRVSPYQSHIIIYTLDGTDVLIVRVRHSREDWIVR
ncbi:MAG: type II toxin-antitoxin system RelE/ParE family toxin [Pseudomonadota bacterium]